MKLDKSLEKMLEFTKFAQANGLDCNFTVRVVAGDLKVKMTVQTPPYGVARKSVKRGWRNEEGRAVRRKKAIDKFAYMKAMRAEKEHHDLAEAKLRSALERFD